MIKTYGQTPKQLFQRPHPMVHIRLTSQRLHMGHTHPIETVDGLHWGHYVGAPNLPPPRKVFCQVTSRKEAVTFLPIAGDRVFGLHRDSTAIVTFASGLTTAPGNASSQNNSSPTGACLLGYDKMSGWVKAWVKKGTSPNLMFPLERGGEDLKFAIAPGTSTLWVGHGCGKVKTFGVNFDPRSLKLVMEEGVTLYGHQGRVEDICHSKEWGIVVSASNDCTCIIWDTRKPGYVMSISSSESVAFKKVVISPTCGDIVAVTETSDLCLFSINGNPIAKKASVEPSITALAFSSAPEGISVNVIATGHAKSGVIRLWSSWDLTPVRDIDCEIHDFPIVSLAFSLDSRHIYASFSDGHLVIFEKASTSSGLSHNPNYLDLSLIVAESSADSSASTQPDKD